MKSSVQLMVTNQILYTIMHGAERKVADGREEREQRITTQTPTKYCLGKYAQYKCIYHKNTFWQLLWMVHQPTLSWHVLIVRQQ